jgi:hypothetical protein
VTCAPGATTTRPGSTSEAREFVPYKFVRGNRVQMEQVGGLRQDKKAWHELTISHDGER